MYLPSTRRMLTVGRRPTLRSGLAEGRMARHNGRGRADDPGTARHRLKKARRFLRTNLTSRHSVGWQWLMNRHPESPRRRLFAAVPKGAGNEIRRRDNGIYTTVANYSHHQLDGEGEERNWLVSLSAMGGNPVWAFRTANRFVRRERNVTESYLKSPATGSYS